jgi:hypothetical protein
VKGKAGLHDKIGCQQSPRNSGPDETKVRDGKGRNRLLSACIMEKRAGG